jgi:hypothetical protein
VLAVPEALLTLLACRKLNEAQVSTAWRRTVYGLLVLECLLVPAMIWTVVPNSAAAAVHSGAAAAALAAINCISSNLERPFRLLASAQSSGLVSLTRLQFKFNERLLSVSTTYRPPGNADLSDDSGVLSRSATPSAAAPSYTETPSGNRPLNSSGHSRQMVRPQRLVQPSTLLCINGPRPSLCWLVHTSRVGMYHGYGCMIAAPMPMISLQAAIHAWP